MAGCKDRVISQGIRVSGLPPAVCADLFSLLSCSLCVLGAGCYQQSDASFTLQKDRTGELCQALSQLRSAADWRKQDGDAHIVFVNFNGAMSIYGGWGSGLSISTEPC